MAPHDEIGQAIDLLVKYDVKFGVTASSPEIQKQSEKLRPSIISDQPRTEGLDNNVHLAKTHPYWLKDNKIYIFTLQQIFGWAGQNPGNFTNGNYEVSPGFWRSQYFFSQVDIL